MAGLDDAPTWDRLHELLLALHHLVPLRRRRPRLPVRPLVLILVLRAPLRAHIPHRQALPERLPCALDQLPEHNERVLLLALAHRPRPPHPHMLLPALFSLHLRELDGRAFIATGVRLDAAAVPVLVLVLVLLLVLLVVVVRVVVRVQAALAEHAAVPEEARARGDAERLRRVALPRLRLRERRERHVRGRGRR
ncbi:hypothetical protein GSI_14285 [Ganoderma sinense ZZ0214-1]|uniref:Uncharacterized protein n=1 Tax=Ganoderma sinense ZZ0214-1 TaxID=1077348 RepID=A0A2G8RSP7_9APHY|nr:hypothetical protein GSI_14285 [Ganoderma sinense ZZ0214-1]